MFPHTDSSQLIHVSYQMVNTHSACALGLTSPCIHTEEALNGFCCKDNNDMRKKSDLIIIKEKQILILPFLLTKEKQTLLLDCSLNQYLYPSEDKQYYWDITLLSCAYTYTQKETYTKPPEAPPRCYSGGFY